VNLSQYGWPLADPHIVSRNRDGRFMPQQQTVLKMHLISPFWSWLFAAFMLALTLGPALFAIREGAPPMVWLLYIPIFGGMSLLIIGSTIIYTRRSNRLRHELQHGPIAHSPGRVTWNGRQYVATVPGARYGKQLKGAMGKIDLPPGEYHFYFLPHSGFLLSAEPIAIDTDSSQAQVSQNLARTFGSTSGELPLNRTGRLSGRQRLRLLSYSIGYALLALLCILFIVGAYFGSQAGNEQISPWLAGCYLLFGIAIVIYALSLTSTRLLDALTGRCHTITGRVEVVTRTAGRSVTTHYLVHGLELNVPHKAYFTTVQGIPYHVYYTPRSKIVTSVEPAGQGT
jgi:hypothetical protein